MCHRSVVSAWRAPPRRGGRDNVCVAAVPVAPRLGRHLLFTEVAGQDGLLSRPPRPQTLASRKRRSNYAELRPAVGCFLTVAV
jgi:hypothetical protein